MRFPFGKHKGKDTADEDVPLDYLVWLEEQGFVKQPLRDALNHEIERRRGDRPGMGREVKGSHG